MLADPVSRSKQGRGGMRERRKNISSCQTGASSVRRVRWRAAPPSTGGPAPPNPLTRTAPAAGVAPHSPLAGDCGGERIAAGVAVSQVYERKKQFKIFYFTPEQCGLCRAYIRCGQRDQRPTACESKFTDSARLRKMLAVLRASETRDEHRARRGRLALWPPSPEPPDRPPNAG